VQEGTAKLCGVREGVRYRMLHSAADQNGDAGVRIWLHRSLSSETRAWAVVSETVVGCLLISWWTVCSLRCSSLTFCNFYNCSKKFVLEFS